ncbi:hypothetical protein [Streptomyces showdoensis]|uniref:hypothetical protein n=1 Tax=Streptomyces showdoensis TaxID=68268 RepID=UPI000F4F4606|nr:hypothetical protein [Streptomyces showdoensis]
MAAPAAADTPGVPQELVVPAAVKNNPLWERVYQAGQAEFGDADSVGAEGVFVREDGRTQPVWTRFSDGKTFDIPGIASATGSGRGTGTDALAFVSDDRVELRHADGRVDTLTLPAGLKGTNVYGLRAVADDAAGRTHILSATADGGTADVIVEEPAGVEYGPAVAGDASTIVLQGPDQSGKRVYTLVDAATGKAQGRLPAVPASFSRVRISGTHLLLDGDHRDGRVLVASRANPSAPLAELPLTVYGNDVALVGDWVVHLPSGPFGKVQAVPLKGGAPVDLLTGQTWGGIGQGGDSAVVVGGPDNSDWAVRRITAGPDGRPVISVLKKVPGKTVPVERLALAQGQLAVIDRSDDSSANGRAWSRNLSTSGALTYGKRSAESLWVDPCPADDTACEEYWPTGDGGFLTHIGGSDGYLTVQGWEEGAFRSTYPGGTARVRDLSGPYVVVDAKKGTSTTQRVLRIEADHEKTQVLEERAPVASALWGSWLWSAGADKGAVTAKDLKTGRTVETLNTGAPCVPEELQAVGRWLYWSCGASGPAGVHDRTEKTDRTVPSGEALLGDGYVVTHDKAAGKLVLTGTEASGSSRVVGSLPDTGHPQRRITWTVDKFGGHLAYADAEGRVHVVPSGLARQPQTLLSREDAANPVVDGQKPEKPVVLSSLVPSRPFGDWTLTARHHGTGKVDTLASGTDGRALRPSWNGKDKAGTLMPNGRYTWTLTARPDGAAGAPTTVTGDVVLRGGASPAESSFTSLPPRRVLDTRNGTGVAKAKVGPGRTITVDLTGTPGVDEDTTTSVALHVTATNPTAGTFVSAYDGSLGRSTASNLNVAAGRTVSNLVVVPVDHGKVTFYNHAGTVDLVADLAGANTAHDEDALYRPMTPWRALDTRAGLGVPKAKVTGGSRARLSFKGTELDAPGVTAVVLNVTATNVSAGTFVTALPKGAAVVGSHLNPGAGETRSNLVVVPVKDGGVDLYNHAGAVDLIADVAGYYTSERVGSLYSSVYPQRLMDTRAGTGVAKAKLGAGGTVTLTVAGRAGVPATGATAVVLNVTATNTTSNTYVTAYPYGTTRTAASNLNVPKGATVSNLVIVPVKDGKVTFYNHGGTADLIADVQGFFAE